MTRELLVFKNLIIGQRLVVMIYISLVVSISLFHVIIDPVWGWDSLNFWIKSAVDIISSNASHDWDHRHPKYLSMLFGCLAKPAASMVVNVNLLPYIFLLGLCCVGVVVVGRFGKSAIAALLIAATIPLGENHLSITGYSEIVCLIFSALGSALICIGLDKKQLMFVVAGVAVSLLLLFVRNTAFLYAGCTLISLVLCVIHRVLGLKHLWILPAVCALSLFIAMKMTWIIDIGRFRYGVEAGENVVYFSEYAFSIGLPDLSRILNTVAWSAVINSSFSVLFITGAFCLMVRCIKVSDLFLKYNFLASITLFGLILFSPNILQYSIYGQDTSYSRFVLAGLGGTILYVIRSVNLLGLMPRRPDTKNTN